jgi:photosystem II stability/assembly factor-like uncharacterized protein
MQRPAEAQRLMPGGKAGARLREFRAERGLSKRGLSNLPEVHTWYADAIKEKEKQRAQPDSKKQPRWSPIGPFSIPHGQTYGQTKPSVSGRISCIAIDPKTAGHMLVGSASGGIWETKDDGASWRACQSADEKFEFPMAIGAIAFHPDKPQTVYAGTGEGNSLSDFGVGLWKSSDGGTTWSEWVRGSFVGQGFYAIVIDPLDPDHMLAATTGGLFEISKKAPTWKALRGDRCWDVSMHPAVKGDPNSTKEAFLATQDGLFRSTDGGSSWPAKVDLPDAPASFERLAVCHARFNGDVVYAFSKDSSGEPALWRRSAAKGPFERLFCPPGIDTRQIDYDWFVSTTPNDPNIVYLGAKSLWRGQSDQDDTWSWANISSRPYGDSIHPDQHAIAFGAGRSVYVGNDGGVFKSPDGGDSWNSLNKGLCITHFEYIAQHPQYDAWLLGGTQDNGTLRYEGGEVWYQVAVGDGGECAINESYPSTVFHCFYNMTLERSLTGGGAGSWTEISMNVPTDYRSLFYPPMEVYGDLVVQAGQSVFVSTDTGTTFKELELPQDAGMATALWLAGPFKFFVGTNSGDVFRFDWAGNGWLDPQTLKQPRAGNISSVRGDPRNPGRLWVTYTDLWGLMPTVYRSDNGGQDWIPCMNGLPYVAANIIEINSSEPDTVYVGTDVGVWHSIDAGKDCKWILFSNGLPNAAIGDLLFHAETGLLRAATRSRGVWEVSVGKDTVPDVQVYLRHSTVDTGRRYRSLQDAVDPFAPWASANWWESTDILADSAPYSIGQVDFVAFEEQRRNDAKTAHGLTHVYVQVHQRGPVSASNVLVRLYVAPVADDGTIPDLPAGFWSTPDKPPAGSAWSVVQRGVPLTGLETGRPQVATFDWAVPDGAQRDVWLLAMVTADNDKLDTTELSAGQLAQNEAKCAIKRVTIAT